MKVKTEKQQSKKNIVKVAIIVFLVALVGYCGYWLASNFADISRLNAQSKDLESKYSQQIEENENIKSVLDSENKDEYIEQKAREKGYVKDGEVVYYDISSSK